MRRLAADEADGVLLNWLSPKAAAEATAELRRDAAGRPARSILYARTIADQAARPVLEQEARGYETVPAYAANFSRLGIRAIDATIDGAERLAAFDVVDELVLRAITPNGSLDELVRFAEATARWRDAAA